MCEFKTGDTVLVSDDNESWSEFVYLYTQMNRLHICQSRSAYERSVTGVSCWKHIKPLPRYEERILDPVRMMQWLVEHGWTPDDEGYWGTGHRTTVFEPNMWCLCGTTEQGYFKWHPEWIEKVEVK